jgi:hypothetical protein
MAADVVPPPPASQAKDNNLPPEAQHEPLPESHPEAHMTAPAPNGGSGSGVTAAIFATVIIVLGLAGIALYAYMQSN